MKILAIAAIVASLLFAGCGGGSSTDAEVTQAVQTYKHWKMLNRQAEHGLHGARVKANTAWKEVLSFSYPVQEAMVAQLKSERK